MIRRDVLLIGTGQAAVPLATRLAAHGRAVTIVERGELGGTCVNVGCTPTKTMIASARAAHVIRSASRLGVHVAEPAVDFPAIVARKDAIVARWQKGVAERLAKAPGLELVRGHARFVGAHEIAVGEARYGADTIVVDVGARPAHPALAGLEDVAFLDSQSALALRELPRHLLILGGGYIGCELGQMFRRFGSEVTIIDHGRHLLAREDEDISSALEAAFAAEGIGFEASANVASVARHDRGVAVRLASGKEITGSHLLVATGRRPNTDELGCDAAGIRLDEHGFILVDDDFRTNVPGVYAVGDVTPGPQFTHKAWDDHRLLFDVLEARAPRGERGRIVPYCVFTDPQVAGVGLSESEAKARGIPYELATMPFGNVARAIEIDETFGAMKVLLEPSSERILGCRIVGSEAGELIHTFVVLMQARASARAIVDVQFVHPTFAEGVQSLVMRLERFALD